MSRVGARSRPARATRRGRCRGERPAHLALRVERDELVVAHGGDEEAVRRPGRVAVAAEQPPRAVRPHDPRAPRRLDEHAARRPAARTSAGRACLTPTAARGRSRRAPRSTTASPGGVKAAAISAPSDGEGDQRPRVAHRPRDRLARLERRADGFPASARVRPPRRAPGRRGAPGAARRPSPHLLPEPLAELVEPAAQARVDRPAWQLEQLGDLAGRVVEQVAQHDHRAVLRRQRGQRGRDRVRVARGQRVRRGRGGLVQLDLGLGAPARVPSRSRG